MQNIPTLLQLIIHRGSHQIGGNCVELVSPNARILIDCGLPLDYDEKAPEIQVKIQEDAKEWLNHCDAVFLSHYHADHYGLLNEAPKGTKVYATKETASMMKISGVFGEDLTELLDVHVVEDSVTVKDFKITKYDVDHSAFGACAFLFEMLWQKHTLWWRHQASWQERHPVQKAPATCRFSFTRRHKHGQRNQAKD